MSPTSPEQSPTIDPGRTAALALRATATWFLLMVLAILNGGARNAWLTPSLGEPTAHVVSTILLSLLILATAWSLSLWIGFRSAGQAWAVGAAWLTATLAFEFLAGHFVFGHSWERLLHDYDLSSGRIWPLVLVATLLAPRAAWPRVQRSRSQRPRTRSKNA